MCNPAQPIRTVSSAIGNGKIWLKSLQYKLLDANFPQETSYCSSLPAKVFSHFDSFHRSKPSLGVFFRPEEWTVERLVLGYCTW